MQGTYTIYAIKYYFSFPSPTKVPPIQYKNTYVEHLHWIIFAD